MKTKARYTQASSAARVASLAALLEKIQENLTPNWKGDEFGAIAKSADWLCPKTAQECVDAIDALSLADSKDLENHVFAKCNDLMSGASFTWDLRNGPVPETGSPGYDGTLTHTVIPLSPGRDYFLQFCEQGECEPLVCTRFAHHYYSEKACMATIKTLSFFVGKDWTLEIRKTQPNHPQYRGVIAIFKSKVASEIHFAITTCGQGKIRRIPEMLTLMQEGVEFFNVVDHDSYGRIRPGFTGRGEVWQYSC